jgi:streptogramin lyase
MKLLQITAMVLASATPFAWALAAEELPADDLVVEAEFSLGSDIIGFGFGSAWGVSGKQLVRIHPANNTVVEIDLNTRHVHSFRSFAFGEGSVWLADTSENKLLKIDPETNQVIKEIPAPMLSGRGSIGVGGGAVWLVTAENVESTLTRINPANGNVEAKIPLPSRGSGVVFDYRSVWVTAPNSGELYRIDPSTNQITSTTRLHGLPGSIATGEGSIWVVNDRDRIIDRIDPMTDQLVSSIATGLVDPVYGSGIAVGGGYVWVAFYPAAIIQIDPKTNAVLRRFMGGLGRGVDYGAESLWKAGPSIQRIQPPSE